MFLLMRTEASLIWKRKKRGELRGYERRLGHADGFEGGDLMLTVGQFAAGFDAYPLQCVAGFTGLDRELTAFSIVDSPEILT